MTTRKPALVAAGQTLGRGVFRKIGRASAALQERTPLRADMLESRDEVLVVFDAPGVEPSDVQVRFDEGRVAVRIDRFRDLHEDFEMRFPGRGLSMDGHFDLPTDVAVDPSGATARLKPDGTLHVTIPKVAKPIDEDAGTIDVGEGDSSDDAEPDADDLEAGDVDDGDA